MMTAIPSIGSIMVEVLLKRLANHSLEFADDLASLDGGRGHIGAASGEGVLQDRGDASLGKKSCL
jgi:hypothetical protein